MTIHHLFTPSRPVRRLLDIQRIPDLRQLEREVPHRLGVPVRELGVREPAGHAVLDPLGAVVGEQHAERVEEAAEGLHDLGGEGRGAGGEERQAGGELLDAALELVTEAVELAAELVGLVVVGAAWSGWGVGVADGDGRDGRVVAAAAGLGRGAGGEGHVLSLEVVVVAGYLLVHPKSASDGGELVGTYACMIGRNSCICS